MDMETSQTLLLATGGAFLAGWVVAKVGGYIARKLSDGEPDPRDSRIRSLAADARVAQSMAEKVKAQLEEKSTQLTDTQKIVKSRDAVIGRQEGIIQHLRVDLKGSVIKTRELRAELTERATENLKSEVKLREVETELSVARSSTELLATGMLEYDSSDDDDLPLSKVRG